MIMETIAFVIDNDPTTRETLASWFGKARIKSVTYRSSADFLVELEPDQPGCLILDLQAPGKGGIELLRELRGRADFNMPIVVTSQDGNVREAVEAMKLGAAEFLLKPLDGAQLVARVQELMIADASRRLQEAKRAVIRRRMQRLSAREGEIVPLICAGHSNKDIGAQLKISTKTIANHRASIISKLEAINTADLVRQVVVATAAEMT